MAAGGEAPVSRLLCPQLSFADLQLQNQGVYLDPTLQRIAGLLEEHSDLVEHVRKDLERGRLPRSSPPSTSTSPPASECSRLLSRMVPEFRCLSSYLLIPQRRY